MTEPSQLIARELPSILSHLWSSTIFLIVVLLVIVAVRRRVTAGAVCSLALIGIAKFAVPAALVAPMVNLVTRKLFPAPSLGQVSLPIQLLGGNFPAARETTPPSWATALVSLWAAVAVFLIIRSLLIRHRLVALALRTATPAHPREVEALARARVRLRIRRSIDIARSALPEAPAVIRILRPMVVLPAKGCDELTDAELESLLCHECAHVARHDNLIARFEGFICALFWFHPAIWIAQRITVIERERACDEVVSETADERDIFLTALRKFCHGAIAPRLPGVSCMATAKLKERIDYVMNYATLKQHAPAPKRITVLAAALMILFTTGMAFLAETALARAGSDTTRPYAIRADATRSGENIVVKGLVSENATQQVVSAPTITIPPGLPANATTSAPGLKITFDALEKGDDVGVVVTIEKDGEIVQRETFSIKLSDQESQEQEYTGAPIDLALTDAELRDVINFFRDVTGLQMAVDDDIEGKVSVNWKNVPWDQAFAMLLEENGLTYRIDGSTIHVSRK